MKINNTLISKVLLFLLMSTSFNLYAMSELRLIEVDEVDVRSKTIVIGGLRYKFELNQEQSSYGEDDSNKSIPLRKVRAGEKYYISFYVKDDIKAVNPTGFDKVVFIADGAPSE